MPPTLINKIIVEAFDKAVAKRGIKLSLIPPFRSGVHYRSGENQQWLHAVGVRPSMSRKGNCRDKCGDEVVLCSLKSGIYLRE